MIAFKDFLVELKISLEYHDELNPVLWENNKLRPNVRNALLKFADTWRDYVNIPKMWIEDIIMVGGNANYNYTSKSDIDVHIIINRSNIGDDPKLVDDYLQDKKTIWTLTHDIKILGYPVEPYVQDIKTKFTKGQGVYSLKDDKWLQEPHHGNYDFKNDKHLKIKVQHYMHVIDHMIKNKMSTDHFENFKTKFRNMRGAAIQKGGEFSLENLVFKELRNRGYLDKMTKYEKSEQDKSLSI